MKGRYWRDDDIRIVVDKVFVAHFLRYTFAVEVLKEAELPRPFILDLGCGTGYGTYLLSLYGFPVGGVDSDSRVIEWARGQFGEGGGWPMYWAGHAEKLNTYGNGSCGAVVAFEVLEHLEDPMLALHEIERVLTDGGRFIFSVPIEHPDDRYHKSHYTIPEAMALLEPFGWDGEWYNQTDYDMRVMPYDTRWQDRIIHMIGVCTKCNPTT